MVDLCGGYYTETLKLVKKVRTKFKSAYSSNVKKEFDHTWLLGLELWYDLHANFAYVLILFSRLSSLRGMLPNICSSLK